MDRIKKSIIGFVDICQKTENKYKFAMISGAFFGLTFFLSVYGIYTLDVTNDSWLMIGYLENDSCQHYTGWLLFRDSPWSWPLGVASNMAKPFGSSIAYTDSLPLVSIIFKALDPILPETFQFFGWWNLICFVLQGVSAALLLALFTEKRSFILIGTSFFVLAPILAERAFRHSSLAAQFYILFALYLYFKSRKSNTLPSWQFFILSFTVTGIHPYYMPMIMGILFFRVIEYAIKNKKIKIPALVLALNLSLVLICCYIIGIFALSGEAYSDMTYPYGYFGMNLNSLYNPVSIGSILWSKFIPALPQARGNYDAFNYLGIGVILLVVFAFVIFIYRSPERKMKIKSFLKRYLWLIIYCSIMTIFAVSNIITLNDEQIFNITLPQWLVSFATIFRSGGRMFYPVSYLLLLSSFIYISRVFNFKKAIAFLLCVLTIQAYDLSPALKAKREHFEDYKARGIIENRFDTEFWNDVAERYGEAYFMKDPFYNYELALFLAKNKISTNLNPSTRIDFEKENAYCDQIADTIKKGYINPYAIYLFKNEEDLRELAPYFNCDIKAYKYFLYYIVLPFHEGQNIPESEYYSEIIL